MFTPYNSGMSIRLGGPIFLKSDDPAELAREHKRLGYRAAYCPPLKAHQTDRIRAVRDAFAKEDVVIAEVGAWCNLQHPDTVEREKNIAHNIERLQLAEEVGARCCVNLVGSHNREHWFGPHPDNFKPEFFDAVVETTRRILDAVNPKRTTYAIEMMQWQPPDSADSYLDLIRAIDRPALGAHFDPVNIIWSPRSYYNNGALIREVIAKLGDRIVSAHAKDTTMNHEAVVTIRECRPGTGNLDYPAFLRELDRLPREIPLMLEHLPNAEEYDLAAAHVRTVAKSGAISL